MSIDEMRKIIADAPKGWTHVDCAKCFYAYNGYHEYSVWMDAAGVKPFWRLMPNNTIEFAGEILTRSSIETIIELMDKLAELEEEVEDVTRNKMISEHAYGRHVLKIEARNKVLEANQTKSQIEMKSKGITEAIKWIGVCWADNIGDSVICVDDLIGYARILDVEASRL